MLKVFLVEDEVVMRNGIKNTIPWEKEGFEFVGEASDGELAYPLIKKEKPDILITDIKMPFMDGLELSRIVKKELPQIKIIILSGYNDFDYAKSAISIGVTDYLLKPIGSAKLLEAIRKVADIIETERENERILERYRKEMEENIQQEKHKLWSGLASNRLSTAELLEKGHQLGIDFTASAYQVVLFKLIQEEDVSGCLRDYVEAAQEIERFAEDWENVITFDRSPDGWAFLIKGSSREEVNTILEYGKKKLVHVISHYPEMEYFGGIGTSVNRLGDVRSSYLEAAKAFSGRFFIGMNKILRAEDLPNIHAASGEKIDVSVLRSKKSEQELIEKFLKSGTQEEIKSFLDEYFRNVGTQNYQSLLYRQYVMMDLFFIVSDFLKALDIGMEEMPEECQDINEIVRNTTSPEDMKKQLERLFEEAMELRDGHSMKKYSALLEEAKAFIQENYQKEGMSLQTVAARVNISPSYFSAIFSSEMGQTFIEYLTSVRLDRAKELLMCSSMRTAEIGYEVGYKDSHYFSYIFKKVVGCSPKEYKNRRKE